MTLQELKEKLQANSIPENLYSLKEGLKPMAHIVYKNYSKWECFYLNERGGQDGYEVFYKEEEAYDWLWRRMEYYLKHPPSIPPKGIFRK